MAGESVATSGETIANNLQKAFVSVVRFSSAFALFGVEQLQTSLSFEEGKGLPKALDDLAAVLDLMTESLEGHLGQSNQDAMKSATRVASRVLQQSMDSLRLLDPRRVLRAANQLVQKSTEALSDQSRAEKAEKAKPEDKPELAVEVLTAPNQ